MPRNVRIEDRMGETCLTRRNRGGHDPGSVRRARRSRFPGRSAQRRLRERVRAALRAAALRARVPRLAALPRAWRARAFGDAALRPSRFRVLRMACALLEDPARFRPERPRAESRTALRRVSAEVVPGLGAPSFTPERRALERPMAIACFVERAPCFPSRMWWISSRTNSPACVEGALPSSRSCFARSSVSCSGIGPSSFIQGGCPLKRRSTLARFWASRAFCSP